MTQLAEHSAATDTAAASIDYVARARLLGDVIRAEADTIEAEATITRTAYEALAEAGMFSLLVPRQYGGAGLGIVEALKVIEEIAVADGSTGWALMANAFSTGIAAGFLPKQGADELFAGEQLAITAGMIVPIGKATREDGGFRCTGRFQFASGSAHATHIGLGFIVHDDSGRPVPDADGEPEARVAFVPKEQVQFLGNWDVMGLVGTGSYDYSVTDLFIPEHLTMLTFSTTPMRPEPVYKLGLFGIGIGGHGPVAMGISRHALTEIARIASEKVRPGYSGTVAESEMFRRDFARHEALYQAARRYLYDAHGDAEATASAGGEISPEQWARLRQVVTWCQEVAADVTRFAHQWGGSQAIRNPSALGRCTRDAAVATQHALVDPMSLVDAATPIIAGYLPR